jgi:hypothetical protein
MQDKEDEAPVPGRECGSCSLCCKLFEIDWLDRPKPGGRWCHHCRPGSGCAIWSARPGSCADFLCLWRRLADLGDEWRPDRAGFVITRAKNETQWNVTVEPTRPAAWEREPYRTLLTRVAERMLADGEVIVLRIGANQFLLLPHGAVPVPAGRMAQDVSLQRGPDGHWRARFEASA